MCTFGLVFTVRLLKPRPPDKILCKIANEREERSYLHLSDLEQNAWVVLGEYHQRSVWYKKDRGWFSQYDPNLERINEKFIIWLQQTWLLMPAPCQVDINIAHNAHGDYALSICQSQCALYLYKLYSHIINTCNLPTWTVESCNGF